MKEIPAIGWDIKSLACQPACFSKLELKRMTFPSPTTATRSFKFGSDPGLGTISRRALDSSWIWFLGCTPPPCIRLAVSYTARNPLSVPTNKCDSDASCEKMMMVTFPLEGSIGMVWEGSKSFLDPSPSEDWASAKALCRSESGERMISVE